MGLREEALCTGLHCNWILPCMATWQSCMFKQSCINRVENRVDNRVDPVGRMFASPLSFSCCYQKEVGFNLDKPQTSADDRDEVPTSSPASDSSRNAS